MRVPVDVANQRELAARFGDLRTPRLVVTDADLNRRASLLGFHDAPDVRRFLESAASGEK